MRARFLSPALVLLFVAVAYCAEPDKTWWAFAPLKEQSPKAEPQRANPIDEFVTAKLRDNGLSLSPEADRRTLIRRLTFDLTGLPPTPEEVAAFEQNKSPKAYEELVDKLLASPAYGERMARLWMDVVHFAETHGHDQDRVRPNAWRYRDYLISAFNADTPYARFVKEQIAADVLYPSETKLIPALGFLSAGPWDESSLRDIREDSIDREAGRYLDRDDIVTNVFNTFSGLTVQCARCHDHKFDPISQEEYYRLQAVFAGIGRGDVPFEADRTIAKKRQELKAKEQALSKTDITAIINTPEAKAAVAAFETKHAGSRIAWTVPDFVQIASANGSKLSMRGDDSILAEGKRPERDTYTLSTHLRGARVTAVRLELYPDDSLPKRGPGRQDNGNLHLSEFRVAVTQNGKTHNAKIRSAVADFDQTGWTVRHAIDGNPATAWGIYPQVGNLHEAIFTFAEAIDASKDTEITFTLAQLHGEGHLIGRFRLSLTDATPPLQVSPLPPAVRVILSTPVEKRTADQTKTLARSVLLLQINEELSRLPKPAMTYAAAPNFAADGSHRPTTAPRDVFILKRGDIRRPGEKVEPGTLALFPKLPANFDLPKTHTEGDRRAALANWLTHKDNALTWRVMANRVWQWHFGTGLASTASDLGLMGQKPTHPELLDFLASELREHQSLKKLHKLIVTSSTYKQSSQTNAKGVKADIDNKLLWRQNRARLDAEQVRDSILAISGRLDRTPGGPSDMQFAMRPGIHVTPIVEYTKFDWDRSQGHRRSVYRFIFRTLPDPLIECLDGADANALTPKRTESVTAPQALALLNNEFILVHAKAMATRLEKHSNDRKEQIAFACRLAWGRAPTAEEAKLFAAYADKHGLANLCRVLFNSNELLFAD